MDDKVQRKIAEAAHAEYGWKLGEVEADEVEDLRTSACSFYIASSSERPLSYQANYAVLPANQVVGIADHEAVGKILDGCAASASADWWAEIVTRFHHNLGAGIVLADEQVRPDIVRKMAKAGMKFTPPAFEKDKRGVSYLLLDPETYILYRVQATRKADGSVEVTKTKLLGGTTGTQAANPMDAVSKTLH